ncbi:MAG TPA: prolyl oligopeptidase family serine peptidase [Gemmataceae bacterium]|nr:prolyl oligopeptidase family serine peptidase [Gemmataceae bacterium]
MARIARLIVGFAVAATLLVRGPATLAGEKDPLIARKVIFKDVDLDTVQLSPDGRMVAYRAESGGTKNVWVAPTFEPSQARPVTRQKDTPVLTYRWSNLPGHVLYTAPAGKGVHVYLLDIKAKTLEPRDLTPIDGVVARVERLSPDHPEVVVLDINDRDPKWHDLYRVNLRTGERQLLAKNDGGYQRFFLDDDFRPRVAQRPLHDLGYELLKADGKGGWVSFAKYRFGIEADASQPVTLDKAGRTLYLVDNRDRDKAALKAIDLVSGKETMLLEDAFADLFPALMTHPKTGRVQAASAYYGRLRRHVLDPAVLPDFDYLRTVHRGDFGVPTIGGRSLDDQTWLVVFMDGGPMRYYAYDRPARRATFLFSENKALDALPLARRYAEVIPVRDGLQLPADLYLPPWADPDVNGRPRKPLPLLLYVHGGSWGAYPWNSWSTNRCLQLLANRGYAVLRVEFRGAGGLGRKIHEAGLREWGGKMQDDLVDAADWAVEHGITTRDRTGIWGWSYGGYATLAAHTLTPDRFACGMAMYGPTDLESFIRAGTPFSQKVWKHYIGDVATEEGRKLLRDRSPLEHVGKITRPVLLVQGGKDEIVPQDQADRFAAAMAKHKKPVTYLLYPDEPHDLRRPENWASCFAVAESFFHEHLGGRHEPISDDLKGSSVEVRVGVERVPGLSEAIARRKP